MLSIPLYLTIIMALACVVTAGLRRTHGEALQIVARAAIVGCVVLLLLANNPQGYRLELIFVPVMAVGAAIAVERYLGRADPDVVPRLG